MNISLFRKGLVIGIIVLFVGAGVIPSTVGLKKEKTTTQIIGSRGYIQDLIDNASDGDTIFVPNGIYHEKIVINQSINLIGEDKYTTIISGDGIGCVVSVISNWVNISGFTIRYGGGERGAGICLGSYTTVTGNIISENGDGISGGYHCSIINNIVCNNSDGIVLGQYAEYNKIENNSIINGDSGLFFTGGEFGPASNNIILNNSFFNTGITIAPCCYFLNSFSNNMVNNKPFVLLEKESNKVIDTAGQIYLLDCDNITIKNQEICNTTVGILLSGSINSLIMNNTISLNNDGIFLGGSNNTIKGNTISSNEMIGIYLGGSSNNIIFHNNFLDNTDNVYDEGGNTWDDGKYGNYWSDYIERYPDAKRLPLKGIWDTPYEIEGGDNADDCPLIKQWPDSRSRTSSFLWFKWLLDCFPLLERLLSPMLL